MNTTISHYEHGPTRPAEGQWTLKIQAEFIEQSCGSCSQIGDLDHRCRVYQNLVTARDAHRTHWAIDPLYVNYNGVVGCLKKEGKNGR